MPTYEPLISEAEYMRVEEADPGRHEYVAGRMFLMTGASRAHNQIVSNLVHHLYQPVDTAGCFLASNDMKLKVQVLGVIYYPDVVVSCEESSDDANVLHAPCLIIEVLSQSTMSIDRREKLMAYRMIPSVREYLLIYQDRKQIDLFRKNDSSEWEYEVYKDSDRVRLTALKDQAIELSLDDVYHQVGLSQES